MTVIADPVSLPEPPPAAVAALRARESYSSISTYQGCPRRYAYRYVERLPGEVPPGWFTFGSAVHAAFEAFDRARIAARASGAGSPDYEVLDSAFGKAIDRSGCEPAEIARLRVRGEPVLRAFLEREAASSAQPIAVELGFGIDVAVATDAPTVRFVGYIDRIDRRPDGAIDLVDHKTGKPRDQADVDRDQQLSAYAFAGARGGLRDPATREILPVPARLGLHFAEAGLTVWTTRTPDQLDAFGQRLSATVGAIRRREFAANPGWACRWCDYRATCPDVVG